MKTPEPNDEADRLMWRRVRRRPHSDAADDALRDAVNDSAAMSDDFIAQALASDPELLAMVRAAHADETPATASAEDLARAKALVRCAPAKPSVFVMMRDWFAAQLSTPRLACAAAFALVCTIGYAAGQSDRASADVATVSVDLLGLGDGDVFDVSTVLEMGGTR